jgi:hypothetical protein
VFELSKTNKEQALANINLANSLMTDLIEYGDFPASANNNTYSIVVLLGLLEKNLNGTSTEEIKIAALQRVAKAGRAIAEGSDNLIMESDLSAHLIVDLRELQKSLDELESND